MAQITNKHRLLAHLVTTLKQRYGAEEAPARPVLEQLVYAICREDTTRDKADRAFRALSERFFDWNEVRVSSPREVEEALSDLPDADVRAHRLISVLQEVFETTFSFDLEALQKKGVKQAAKQLSRYQAASDFSVAWVSQHTLGGSAIAMDTPALRVLRRLEVIEDGVDDPELLAGALESLVPKSRMAPVADLFSALADEFCHDDPLCPRCPLHGDCPTGQETARAVPVGRGRKPR
jgi:endonuclease-3